MDIKMLEERNKYLMSSLENSKREVIELTDKLERAKNNYQMILGHCNESSYIYSQAQIDAKSQLEAEEGAEIGCENEECVDEE